MTPITIIPDMEGQGADLDPEKVIHTREAWTIGGLRGGMVGGDGTPRTSVMVRIPLPDGRTVIAETSLRLLYAAVRAIAIRHGQRLDEH